MNKQKIVDEFEKDFLKKEKSFSRVVPEDASVFDPSASEKRSTVDGVIYLNGKSPIPIGNIIIGQKSIIDAANQLRTEIHKARYFLISHLQDNISFEREEETVRGFSWIVRLYRWLHRNNWEMMSLESLRLIDGLIHTSKSECHQRLVIKNEKENSTITICKLFHKRGYLIQQRSLTSLLDRDNSNIKTVIADKIIQIKKAINGFADTGKSVDDIDLLNI